MKSNKPLIAILVALIFVAICACVGTVAFFGWSFRDQITQALQDPSSLIQDQNTQPALETPIAVGEDVDLNQLFSPMWEVRQILRDEFFEQPISDSVLAQGAVDGLTAFVEEQGVDLASVEISAGAPSAEDLATEAGTPEEAASDFCSFLGCVAQSAIWR